MLLQALNDQNQAAIDEYLATKGVKDWINHRAMPEQLDNHIREFKDVKSITCLAFASLVSEARTVQQLIEAGADVAVTDSEGFSPLHYACASDADSDVKTAYLMQRESSQRATGGSEQLILGPDFYSTSLRLAARHNLADRVRALIDDHGASVNATDEDGWTALHLAARAGHAEAVKVLVQHPSCDVSITDRRGRTAADWARRRRRDNIAALIEAKSNGNFTKLLLSVTSFVFLLCAFYAAKICHIQ